MSDRRDEDKGAADMKKRIVLAAMLGLAIAMPAQAQQPAKASDLTSRGVINEAARQAYEDAIEACAGGVVGKMPQGARFVRCLKAKVTSERDALAGVYKSTLSFMRSGEQAARLRSAQGAWVDYRDENCAFARMVAPKEQADEFYYDCMLKTTIDRRVELRSLVGD
jgi:uncharacterized protein YecT (DUF1311 family)